VSSRRSTRPVRAAVVAGLALIALSLGAWITTGREGYTRWPDAKLDAADQPTSAEAHDLLDDIGLATDEDPPPPTIESRFALGLMPSGADPKHVISVVSASTIGLAMVIAGAIFHRPRGRKTAPHGKEPRT